MKKIPGLDVLANLAIVLGAFRLVSMILVIHELYGVKWYRAVSRILLHCMRVSVAVCRGGYEPRGGGRGYRRDPYARYVRKSALPLF
jgi:hypothetical protein